MTGLQRDVFVVAEKGRRVLLDLVQGRRSPGSITRADEAHMLHACAVEVRQRQEQIRGHLQRVATRSARRGAVALRGSLAARTRALFHSLPRAVYDVFYRSACERAALREQRWAFILGGLNEVSHLASPARYTLSTRAKSTPGQYRAISEFGSIDTARQRLIRSSLDPFVDFHPSQFMLRQTGQGRGRSAVSKSLLRQLPRLGPDHVFVQMDVTKFYQSVSHAWLEDNLPLPRDIIRSQVHVGGMTVSRVRDDVAARLGLSDSGALERMVRQGLPTGSALSPLVAEFVMSKVLGELADRHAASMSGLFVPSLHAYSDNLGIFVRRAEAGAIVDLVRGAFASSAAGPFDVTASKPISIGETFKFLGYWFRVKDGTAEAFVPDEVAEYRKNLILKDILTASPLDLIRKRRTARGMAAEMAQWADVGEWHREIEQVLDAAQGALLPPPWERRAA